MSFLIKDDGLLEKYNEIRNMSAIESKWKWIESEPVYNENCLKAKLRSEECNEASVSSIYLSNGNID